MRIIKKQNIALPELKSIIWSRITESESKT